MYRKTVNVSRAIRPNLPNELQIEGKTPADKMRKPGSSVNCRASLFTSYDGM